MATSPITTPAQAQQILDLSNSQFNSIRNYFGINDNPLQPDKTYIVFDAASGNNTLHLDTGGSTSYSILKGDGTAATSYTDTGGDKTLTYAVAGRYLITIDGTFNGIDTTGASSGDKGKYIAVVGGTNYPSTIVANAFRDCLNLELIKFDKNIVLEIDVFRNCDSLLNNNNEYICYNTGLFFNISTVSGVTLASLNYTDFAYADAQQENLETYRFNGLIFEKVGNSLGLGSISDVFIASLNSTDIAYISETNLRTYRFDGTDWAQVGNTLTVTGATNGSSIASLNSTDIAFIDAGNKDLRTYRFDGTDWAQVGNDLNIAGLPIFPRITSLNSTDIALTSLVTPTLETYRFDGTDWAQVGNTLSLTSGGITNPGIISLDSKTVLISATITAPASNTFLVTYSFNGTDWVLSNEPLFTGINFGNTALAIIGNKIVIIGNTDENLRLFTRIHINKWRI